jgi:hypothetical protein
MKKLTSGIEDIPPFPASLTSLDVTECTAHNYKFTQWPPNLQILVDHQRFFRDAKALAPTLQKITFAPNFNNDVDNLPPAVRELTFGLDFRY